MRRQQAGNWLEMTSFFQQLHGSFCCLTVQKQNCLMKARYQWQSAGVQCRQQVGNKLQASSQANNLLKDCKRLVKEQFSNKKACVKATHQQQERKHAVKAFELTQDLIRMKGEINGRTHGEATL